MDYEQEECQTTLDVADMLLEHLVTECVKGLSDIEQRRHPQTLTPK